MYGDALLFTDTQGYWAINPELIDDEVMAQEVCDLVTTKHMVKERRDGEQEILFIERPSEDDLVSLRLLFS